MKTIPLGKSQNLFATVDDDDFERVSMFRWSTRSRSDGKGFYVARNIKIATRKYRHQLLHHFLMSPPTGLRIDHKDGDGLNNVRSNLRLATQQQNSFNQKKQAGQRTSRYKGVTKANLIHGLYEPTKQWRSRIRVNNKLIEIGHFLEECDAATAYNFAALECFGEFANFNVPKDAL